MLIINFIIFIAISTVILKLTQFSHLNNIKNDYSFSASIFPLVRRICWSGFGIFLLQDFWVAWKKEKGRKEREKKFGFLKKNLLTRLLFSARLWPHRHPSRHPLASWKKIYSKWKFSEIFSRWMAAIKKINEND